MEGISIITYCCVCGTPIMASESQHSELLRTNNALWCINGHEIYLI